MSFKMNCTNKKCFKFTDPYIDKDTNIVYCGDCDKEIINVTNIAKNQMKFYKQYKQVKPTSFSVKCYKCKKEGRPIIVNDNVICSSCNSSLDKISDSFKNMFKQYIKNIDKDV